MSSCIIHTIDVKRTFRCSSGCPASKHLYHIWGAPHCESWKQNPSPRRKDANAGSMSLSSLSALEQTIHSCSVHQRHCLEFESRSNNAKKQPYRTSADSGSHPKMEKELGFASSTQQPAPVGEPRKVKWLGHGRGSGSHIVSTVPAVTCSSPALLTLLKAFQDPFNKFFLC